MKSADRRLSSILVSFAAIAVALAAAAIIGLVWQTSGRLPEAAAQAAAKAPYKPIAPLEVVMEQADELFQKFEEDVTAEKFRTLKKTTVFVAELMNVTAFYDATKYSKEPGWDGMSSKVRDLLVEAGTLATGSKGAELKALLPKIEAACETCHEKYRDI